MRRTQLMDQRWNPRQPLVLDLTLHHNGQMPLAAVTRDVSICGTFVVTTTPIKPALNSQVYVVFTHRADGMPSRYRLPARVIRLEQDGAGLMFSDFSADTIQTLRKILYLPLHETRTRGIQASSLPRQGAR